MSSQEQTDTKAEKRVLIVDDEAVIRDVSRRSLESKGFSVVLADNGIQALERLRKEPFDIVFSDYKMPIMDGIELLEAVKRDHPHVEVIIMTAFATIERAIDALKKGAYDFILKPVKPEQIRFVAQKCHDKIQLSEENRALKRANEKLTELQNLKNKFIAITSHELRTPVSHLKGYLGILNDDYYNQLTEDEKNQCMQVIVGAVAELEEIVASMHKLTDLEEGQPHLKHEALDLTELIDQCVQSYGLIAKRRNQEIDVQKIETELPVVADRTQIKGILNEFLQNAIKFTPDGGKVSIVSSADDDYCVVSVRDTGIGIAKAEQGMIFEKFYEVQNSNYHSSSKEAFLGGGLGLGLASVRAIAEAHGGAVKVKSKADSGSEFLLYLPKMNTPAK